MEGSATKWGEALLVADVERVGAEDALGLDKSLFQCRGKWNSRT